MRALLLAVLCACTSESTDRAAAAIIGGTLDTTDTGVVALSIDGGQNVCSAVVVSPHVVVTAAHCVNNTGDTFLQVLIGTDYGAATATIDVTEVHFDSLFDANNPQNGHDIGVAILASAAPVTPIALNTTSLTSGDDGKPIRFVGYGVTSSSSNNSKRMTAASSVSFHDMDTITAVDAQHNACNGDSGGAALMTFGGNEVLAGVLSSGNQQCTTSISTRVDVELAFVQPYIAQHDPSGDAGASDSGADASIVDASSANDASNTDGSATNDGGSTSRGGGGCNATGGETGPAWLFAALALVMGRRRARR